MSLQQAFPSIPWKGDMYAESEQTDLRIKVEVVSDGPKAGLWLARVYYARMQYLGFEWEKPPEEAVGSVLRESMTFLSVADHVDAANGLNIVRAWSVGSAWEESE
jgi:hypothetical protein